MGKFAIKFFSLPFAHFKIVVGFENFTYKYFILVYYLRHMKKFNARTVGSVHLCKHKFLLDQRGLGNAQQGKTGVLDMYSSIFFM